MNISNLIQYPAFIVWAGEVGTTSSLYDIVAQTRTNRPADMSLLEFHAYSAPFNPGQRNPEGMVLADDLLVMRLPQYPTAEPFLPPRWTLPALREAAASCTGCPLYKTGTQTVFGEGSPDALAVLIGEQPGDQEDRAGRPFVGPAGQILDRALDEVGIDRSEVYLTNAVKHFKWERRGTRRIHSKPGARELAACKPWLMAELEVIHPRMVVCLGATAAQDLMGSDFRITRQRGIVFPDTPYAPWFLATLHPSAILRMPEPALREQAYRDLVADLTQVKQRIDYETGRH